LGWKVYFVLVTLHVVVCGLLIMVIMLQSGEAADLAGAFGGAGSQTAFGPRGAATFLSKATTWCAIMFMLCAMAMVLRSDKAVGQGSSFLEKISKPAPKPVPVTPATTPATSPVTPPVTSQPSSQVPAGSQPTTQQAPATSQPAPAPPKKP
jgi:preprotein translocase subunit SecG